MTSVWQPWQAIAVPVRCFHLNNSELGTNAVLKRYIKTHRGELMHPVTIQYSIFILSIYVSLIVLLWAICDISWGCLLYQKGHQLDDPFKSRFTTCHKWWNDIMSHKEEDKETIFTTHTFGTVSSVPVGMLPQPHEVLFQTWQINKTTNKH